MDGRPVEKLHDEAHIIEGPDWWLKRNLKLDRRAQEKRRIYKPYSRKIPINWRRPSSLTG